MFAPFSPFVFLSFWLLVLDNGSVEFFIDMQPEFRRHIDAVPCTCSVAFWSF
jgi:hypothetical protein